MESLLTELLREISSVCWTLFALVWVIAGVILVRAAPMAHHCIFLFGAILSFCRSLFFSVVLKMESVTQWLVEFNNILIGISILAGSLMAYGVVGIALSYSKLITRFKHAD